MNIEFISLYIASLIYVVYKLGVSKTKLKSWNDYNNWTTNFYNYKLFLLCSGIVLFETLGFTYILVTNFW